MLKMSELPDNAPPPRLCHIKKWEHFQGYGFNLHADKTRAGQYIGKVDPGSPSEMAGLKEGDRIIEVNDVNIANENHKQVVQRIKAVNNSTKLLVVDDEADKFYKTHNIVVNHDMPNIKRGTSDLTQETTTITAPATSTPPPDVTKTTYTPPSTNGHREDDSGSVASVASSTTHSDASTHSQSQMSTSPSPPPPIQSTPVTNTKSPSPNVNAKNFKNMGGLNLNMSAAEMREYLKKNRKPDPRKDTGRDLKEKYKIIQSL